MAFMRWTLGGLIAGGAGVVVWVLIGYFAQYELGWLAWGIGFLVGVGVRYAAYLGDQEESVLQGILAAGLALGCILVAKYLVFSLLVGGSVDELRELGSQLRFDDEAMIARMADEIAEQMMDEGRTIDWPPGMTYEEALRKPDYPPALWQQAERNWASLPAGEQEERKRTMALFAAELSAAAAPQFKDFFTPWDILWFILATATAFRIGVGSYGDDE